LYLSGNLSLIFSTEKLTQLFKIEVFWFTVILTLLIISSISSCAKKPPSSLDNICTIFDEKSRWYKHAKKSAKKWGTPVQVQMAILKQESSFKHDAKPKRKKLLGFIPWTRQSSAFGYAQVLDETWEQYIDESGNNGADRDSFKDAIDFIGWYTFKTHSITGVSKWDAYNQYLAYHEGQGGFQRKTFKNKKWLLETARRVDNTAKTYSTQLKNCQ
jgi:hypothetical protein